MPKPARPPRPARVALVQLDDAGLDSLLRIARVIARTPADATVAVEVPPADLDKLVASLDGFLGARRERPQGGYAWKSDGVRPYVSAASLWPVSE